MTTNLCHLGIEMEPNDFSEPNDLEPNDFSEIDPPVFVKPTQLISEWKQSVCDSTLTISQRLVSFQQIFQSTYQDKKKICSDLLLMILSEETLSQEDRFLFLSQLKLSSDTLEVCLYGYIYWFYTFDHPLIHKILSAQFILSHPLSDYPFMKTHMKFTQQFLYDLSKTGETRVRSEVADILIRLGTLNFRKAAQKVITQLGNEYIPPHQRTIYTDSQNVHEIQYIEESTRQLIKHTNPLVMSMDDIFVWISQQEDPLLLETFQRIMMDTSVYYQITLMDILRRVFQCITHSSHRTELEKRFIEELHEMNGWCSSGHVVRLLNVLNGFESFIQLSIPIKDEIRSAVFSRLQYALKKCSPSLQEEIIMCFQQEDQLLLDEFIETYSPYHELRKEYDHITLSEFDLYYHQSILHFKGK